MIRMLRYLGAAAALGLVAFVVWRGAPELPPVDLRAPATWGWLGTALGLYAASQALGAIAWRAVLSAHGSTLPAGRAESQFLLSQIGKYVPGNVGHLVGRYALCRQDGVPGARIGSALTMEIGVLLATAALVSAELLLALPAFRGALATGLGEAVAGPVTGLMPVLLIAALAALQVVLWRRAGRPRIAPGKLVAAGALYAITLVLMGLSVWCLARLFPAAAGVDLLTATAVFSVAWTAGFVMPGAPGGIGIRDGIVALGLGLFMGEGAALAVAVAHRLVSGIGDGVTFAAGLGLRAVTRAPEGGAGARVEGTPPQPPAFRD
ncbi:lysylphosphatidylglycerol synthase domain-containing protein [Jannaschia formosa]|uniref:lysylphosphatidylglycerol synthase domain-containing protein n=1 Tax=Jannaschia formosa TaxID=2259592 RepID=UPI000E1B6053|nr:lysylphosphatidylglycerol synthase domain-containing protein [Jannaschia formosa]TFL18092.1 flippase-like domain-containing protein [Jannaschia formosa]